MSFQQKPKQKPLSLEVMLNALKRLDELVPTDVVLFVGGGGAMVMAHQFPLATTDVDALSKGMTTSELDPFVKQIAKEQGLPGDWLNPYFSTFAHTLPADYGQRLITVLRGIRLRVECLGREDMLIMKCFAHRTKDVGHSKALIKAGADTDFVGAHIEKLKEMNVRGCQQALEFLDDLLEQL
jgi:hypothetical protein